MAEVEATKRERGRPKGPVSDKLLRYLLALKDGPLTQKEIRARCPELSRGTVSNYSNRFPSFVEKTSSGYSLTPSGQAELQSRELQRDKNRVMAAFERTNQKVRETEAAFLVLAEKRERSRKYLEKNADVISRHPKFSAIQDPVLQARAVDAFLDGMLCYNCFDPKIVNEEESLEHFLNRWDNEGRTFCKKCWIELFKGGEDIRIVPRRKRAKKAIKIEETWALGTTYFPKKQRQEKTPEESEEGFEASLSDFSPDDR